jgi:hypothetical protein
MSLYMYTTHHIRTQTHTHTHTHTHTTHIYTHTANLAIYDPKSASIEVVGWDRTHGLVAHLLQVVRQDVMSLSPTCISQCIWGVGKSLLALATTKQHKEGVEAMQQTLDALTTELVARGAHSLGPQAIAMSLYGLAKAGYLSPRLQHYFDLVQQMLVETGMGNYTSQHLANTAWSFAFFRRPGHELMKVVEEEMRARNLTDFSTGELSMTLWACAKYKYKSQDLYSLIAGAYLKRGLGNCSAQELANLAWALSAAAVQGDEHERTVEAPAHTNANTVANTNGNSKSTAQSFWDTVLGIAQTCVDRKLVVRASNDVRNILSCVVKLRTPDAGLCAEVADDLGKKPAPLRAWVQSFWMFAQLRYQPPAPLVATFRTRLEKGTLITSDSAYVSKAHYAAAKFLSPFWTPRNEMLQNKLADIRNSAQHVRPPLTPLQKQAASTDQTMDARDTVELASDDIEMLWSLTCMQCFDAARGLTQKTLASVSAVGGRLSLQHLLLLEWSLGALDAMHGHTGENGWVHGGGGGKEAAAAGAEDCIGAQDASVVGGEDGRKIEGGGGGTLQVPALQPECLCLRLCLCLRF